MSKTGFTLFRSEGLIDPAAAKRKRIAVLGLGSLGSETVAQLAYEWGSLILIDPDVLKLANIERHVLGMPYIGMNKAEAMRRWLIEEKGIPDSSVSAYAQDDQEVLDSYVDIDLLICCIDDQTACRRINSWCVSHGVPAVYGGVYPKGVGGEVISLPTPQDVCYICAEFSRGEQLEAPHNAGDYGIDPTRLNLVNDHPAAVPALRKSIVAISADMAYAAWQILFPEEGGDDLQPKLLYHALDGWVQVAQLRGQSEVLGAVARFIGARRTLQLVRDGLRLGKPDTNGWYPVEIRQGFWPKVLVQWERCPLHGTDVDIENL